LKSCPALMIVQTWYAFVVCILSYVATMMANRSMEYEITDDLRFDGGINNYVPSRVFSEMHPMYLLVKRWVNYDFPLKEQKATMRRVERIVCDLAVRLPVGQVYPIDVRHDAVYFGCITVAVERDESEVYKKEEYKKHVKYTEAVSEAVLTNLKIYDYMINDVEQSSQEYNNMNV